MRQDGRLLLSWNVSEMPMTNHASQLGEWSHTVWLWDHYSFTVNTYLADTQCALNLFEHYTSYTRKAAHRSTLLQVFDFSKKTCSNLSHNILSPIWHRKTSHKCEIILTIFWDKPVVCKSCCWPNAIKHNMTLFCAYT